MSKRRVISVSFSEKNPDAVVVAQALRDRGITLGHGGGKILAWAAAAIQGKLVVSEAPSLEESFGMTEQDISASIDAW